MNTVHCIYFIIFIIVTASLCVFEVTTLELSSNRDKEFIIYRTKIQNVLNTYNSPTIPLPSTKITNSTTDGINQVIITQPDEKKLESIRFY